MNNNRRIINIISNRNYESRKIKEKVKDKFREKGFIATEDYDRNAELNVCIGGDGAFLRAVHRNKFSQIPFVGINTGHLGFFQEISTNRIDEFIQDFVNGNYVNEKICLVQADIVTKRKSYRLTAVNEIVVKGVRSKVIHLDILIDNNHLQKFCGDGVIMSTPSGSTAYNFSAGGSIVYPTLEALQITPLSPINSKAYRSLYNSMVLAGHQKVTIKPELRYSNLTLIVNDGMEFSYDNIVKIDVCLSDKTINMLKFSEFSYWENLKSKFL